MGHVLTPLEMGRIGIPRAEHRRREQTRVILAHRLGTADGRKVSGPLEAPAPRQCKADTTDGEYEQRRARDEAHDEDDRLAGFTVVGESLQA